VGSTAWVKDRDALLGSEQGVGKIGKAMEKMENKEHFPLSHSTSGCGDDPCPLLSSIQSIAIYPLQSRKTVISTKSSIPIQVDKTNKADGRAQPFQNRGFDYFQRSTSRRGRPCLVKLKHHR
jgi:hypothetical protein